MGSLRLCADLVRLRLCKGSSQLGVGETSGECCWLCCAALMRSMEPMCTFRLYLPGHAASLHSSSSEQQAAPAVRLLRHPFINIAKWHTAAGAQPAVAMMLYVTVGSVVLLLIQPPPCSLYHPHGSSRTVPTQPAEHQGTVLTSSTVSMLLYTQQIYSHYLL